jgi:hypothetical protein
MRITGTPFIYILLNIKTLTLGNTAIIPGLSSSATHKPLILTLLKSVSKVFRLKNHTV